MKVSRLTKNRRARRGSPRLSLFPFLAVLICTMGALVPLLLAVMRQAKIQAVRESAAKAARQQQDRTAGVQSQRELAQWRVEQLRQSRQATEKDLADWRLVLGHLEDHGRRLREQLARLQANSQSLDLTGNDLARRRMGTQQDLEKLQAQVAEAQRRVDQARQEAMKKPRSYAIIPYQGPQETHRRPIYLECRADTVVLQPEGIEFVEDDFDGPLGSGNPLATALRAAREYLMTQGGFDPQRDGEPYPLLLVRPAGISAYYAALSAMESWRSEFGYEMIGDDWPLVFPKPDPQLARTLDQAVAGARIRQQAIVAAAPSRFRSASPRPSYRVADNGTVVRDNSLSGEGESGYRSQPSSPRLASSYSPGGGGGQGGSAGSGPGGPGGGGMSPGGPAAGGPGAGTPGGGNGSGGYGTGAYGNGGAAPGGPWGVSMSAGGAYGNGYGTGAYGNGGAGTGFAGMDPGGMAPGGNPVGAPGGFGVPGLASVGNGAGGAGGNGGYGNGAGGNGAGGNGASGNGASGNGASGNGGNGTGGSSNGTSNGGYGSGGTQAPGSGYAVSGQGVPTGGAGPSSGGPAMAGNTSGNASRNTAGAGPGDGSSSGGQGKPVEIPEGYLPGQPRDGPPPPRPDPPAGAGPGSPLRPGEWYPSPERMTIRTTPRPASNRAWPRSAAATGASATPRKPRCR